MYVFRHSWTTGKCTEVTAGLKIEADISESFDESLELKKGKKIKKREIKSCTFRP